MGCNQYNIEEFLEKFWEGKTSLEEENAIKEFFAFNDIPENLSEQASYFELIHCSDEVELGDDFDQEMMNKLDNHEGSSYSRGRLISLSNKWVGIAASLVIFLSVFWWTSSNKEDNSIAQDQATFEHIDEVKPEKNNMSGAFNQTKNALFMFSTKLNKGLEPISKLERFNEAQDIINNRYDSELESKENTKK